MYKVKIHYLKVIDPANLNLQKKVAKFQYLEVGLNVDLAWHRKNKAFAGGMHEDSGSNY